MPALPGIRHRASWMPRPGIAGVPPASGRRPAGVFKRARCPRSQGSDTGPRGCRVPGSRASRPHRAAGPPVCSSGQDARAPRDPTPGLVDAASWDRGRPARKWAEGPPVCSSGQDARAPRDSTPGLVDAASWDRGRPARKWAEGPQVCSSGRDARAPRRARELRRLAGHQRGVAGPGERVAHGAQRVWVVIDHQDARLLARRPARRRRGRR